MPDASPFAVLSLIVAPAILTNASSVLAMSTSNRLARAVDRARELSRQLETEKASLGAFAFATLISLVGAVATRTGDSQVLRALEVVALTSGGVAVAAIVHGSALLLRARPGSR